MKNEFMNVPIFSGEGKVHFEERKIPTPGENQLLIQAKANLLCGSDRNQFYNGSPQCIPGHEGAGVIVEKGKNAKFEIGMKGAVYLYDYCNKCRSCQLGLTNQCLHKNCDYGFNVDGAFCEYYLVNDYVFFPVDESVDVINATLLLDVMGTGGHATKRAQLIHKDIQSVLINGAGPIGLGLLAMSKLTFAKDLPVLINDVKSSRLPLAEKMGGLPIDLSKQSLEEGMEKHGIKNPDVAIDATGKAIARKNALNVLAKRGVLVMVGNGEGLEFEQYPDMGGPERSILGSEYFSYNEMEANHELLKNNQEYLSQIITHEYNIKDVQKSYEHFFSPDSDAGKIAVVHN
tara:strand:- start:657 stop:1691 length:1035 start_codon:yes stop_codon:yes gene_type:complete